MKTLKPIKALIDAGHLKSKDFGLDAPKAHLMELRAKELADMYFEKLRVKKAQEESYKHRSDYSAILYAITNSESIAYTSKGVIAILTEPQRCGTESQKIAYARMKAQEIVKQLNEEK